MASYTPNGYNLAVERTEQKRLFFISVRSVAAVANVQFLRA